MVDFQKLLGKKIDKRVLDPLKIFINLDKESTKEYLRPAQESVLKEWHSKFRNNKDLIVKLHTGQGKTLIGLLILQSSLAEKKGPAIYICPNNFLVHQTIKQARAFGIKTVQFSKDSKDIPLKFLNSEAILVTNCKKLFNGRSVFGILGGLTKREPISIGSIVMDDAHKCLEIIKESFSFIIKKYDSNGNPNDLYSEIFYIFADSLRRQAEGTFLDIEAEYDRFLAVPFWSWFENKDKITKTLSEYKDKEEKDEDKEKELFFVWDLIKNHLEHCTCIISGKRIEIVPRLLPLYLIPSFWNAERRIFLSATLTKDEILVRDLGLNPDCVTQPLTSGDEKYSGERLIILPSLVQPDISFAEVKAILLDNVSDYGNFGVFVIVPSLHLANRHWKEGEITNVQTLYRQIEQLNRRIEKGTANEIIVLLNAYDGIDLPDNTCRILCLDSLPMYMSLIEQYESEVRLESTVRKRMMAQRIEQGIGRGIRGTSDWCIVLIIGNDLSNFLSERVKRAFFSKEAQMQIKIGEDVALLMRQESHDSSEAIEKLIKQCLARDNAWKQYYKERMDQIERDKVEEEFIEKAELERNAEEDFQKGLVDKAITTLRSIESAEENPYEKGWYLQLMAIYEYRRDPSKAMDLQLKAYSLNNRLSRTERGITYSKILPTDYNRADKILERIRKHDNHNTMLIKVQSILDNISFPKQADLCEDGVEKLGKILGFDVQRPERTYGYGPDNLWYLGKNTYWSIECKSNVISKRGISKSEIGQLSNSIGWFKKEYSEGINFPIIIHPSEFVEENAFSPENFGILHSNNLNDFKECIINFFNSLRNYSFEDLSRKIIREKLIEHGIDLTGLKRFFKIIK